MNGIKNEVWLFLGPFRIWSFGELLPHGEYAYDFVFRQ